MIKKIRPTQVRMGMFVVEYGIGTFSKPMATYLRIVDDADDLSVIRTTPGHVVIDDAKGSDVDAGAPPVSGRFSGTDAGPGDFQVELALATKVYNRARQSMDRILDEVRAGRDVDLSPARDTAHELAASLSRHPKAIGTLATLRTAPNLAPHSVNVAILSATLGRHLGLPSDHLHKLALGGLLHDLGKALLPAKLLSKTTPLTKAEQREMMMHPIKGFEFLRSRSQIGPAAARCALEHHERFDGSGYPRRLTFDKISPHARLVSMVDVFDGLTSDKPGRRGIMPKEALKRMYRDKDRLFFSEHLEQFIKCLGIYPVGSFIRLSDGRYAVVVDTRSESPLYPTVKIVYDRKMRPIRPQFQHLSAPGPMPGDHLSITDCIDPDIWSINVERLLA